MGELYSIWGGNELENFKVSKEYREGRGLSEGVWAVRYNVDGWEEGRVDSQNPETINQEYIKFVETSFGKAKCVRSSSEAGHPVMLVVYLQKPWIVQANNLNNDCELSGKYLDSFYKNLIP